MRHLLSARFAILSTVFLTATALAQWPASPDTNMVIGDHANQQTVSKITATPLSGGLYFCRMETSSFTATAKLLLIK